ncbi:hypothetical protein FRC12_011937 [Ceratobasidium sp. 428]|nr:hypothetical protein FRC09_011878 [Ceratobasidium sp. 395]KAG8752477.1 hypothetical protein FRC12_011937 [Ceratobasidium sp. 428]
MSTPLDALEISGKQESTRVLIQFKAVGNAPIMKKNEYGISSSQPFQAIVKFLRGQLGLKSGDPLFTYINLSFAPAPDERISNLFKSFAVDGKLIVNYCSTAAWG